MATANTNGHVDDDVMAELNDDDFDETRVPIVRRILYVRAQIAEWNEIAYNTKVAFQTNKALGVTTEELASLVAQFTRARAAVKELETRLGELEVEKAKDAEPGPITKPVGFA